ncbi:MAG: ATP-binding cassette domain-containing protein, partial [Gemmatimonadetes bacterium]|nr:ATP-binding cassette domain-containing protein [Gemmatimonadota bacterium]
MPRIDAHVHVFARACSEFPREVSQQLPADREESVEKLLAQMERSRVDQAVLVQIGGKNLEHHAYLRHCLKAHAGRFLGIGLVPEGRQVFPNLTVHENLVATAANRTGRAATWELDRVLEMFPALKDRLSSMGNLLSGGEQQMLAIGRALMTNPKLLVLDEATEGLAPLVRRDIWTCLSR